MGGPEVLGVTELVAQYLRAAGKRRGVAPLKLPGAALRELAAGANLAPGNAGGRQRFAQFLTERLG